MKINELKLAIKKIEESKVDLAELTGKIDTVREEAVGRVYPHLICGTVCMLTPTEVIHMLQREYTRMARERGELMSRINVQDDDPT